MWLETRHALALNTQPGRLGGEKREGSAAAAPEKGFLVQMMYIPGAAREYRGIPFRGQHLRGFLHRRVRLWTYLHTYLLLFPTYNEWREVVWVRRRESGRAHGEADGPGM